MVIKFEKKLQTVNISAARSYARIWHSTSYTHHANRIHA